VEARDQRAGGVRLLIPRAYVQAWSAKAPWPDLRQVRLVTKLKGKPWKSSDEAIAELRLKRFPGLLLNG